MDKHIIVITMFHDEEKIIHLDVMHDILKQHILDYLVIIDILKDEIVV